MKRAGVFVFLVALSSPVLALPGTTDEGYVACLKRQWLDDMGAFAQAGDRGSFDAYVQQKKCVVMRAGLKVTVTDGPGMFGGQTGFIYKGTKLWTVREAIEYGK